MASQRPLISRGERAPDFVARRGVQGQPTRFYAYVGGRPAVLVFSAQSDTAEIAEIADQLRSELDSRADVLVVAPTDATDDDAFIDPEGAVHRAYGVPTDGPAQAVVLDPNVRVVATVAGDDVGTEVEQAVAAVAHSGEGSTVGRHAPVLFVSDALDTSLCAQLMELWEREGSVVTGVEATVGADRVVQTDDRRKQRRDHIVTDAALMRTLSTHIGRRVMPEIRKAFASEVNRFEGFKVGCYDAADQGFFTRHRDNLSPSTVHRRFGLTINLNDDYDGGELHFPEYGLDRFRPDPGEALVFSGSHLHEVLPVTRGRRFVLLSFLFAQQQGAG